MTDKVPSAVARLSSEDDRWTIAGWLASWIDRRGPVVPGDEGNDDPTTSIPARLAAAAALLPSELRDRPIGAQTAPPQVYITSDKAHADDPIQGEAVTSIPASSAPVTGSTPAPLPVAVDRTWTDGAVGDWYDAGQYTSTDPDGAAAPAGAPAPGDVVRIRSGTVTLAGSEAADNGTFNANAVYLGADGPATLQAQQATLGPSFRIYGEGQAQLVSDGTSTFQGSLSIEQGSATLGSVAGGDLIIDGGSPINVPASVTSNESLTLVGTITMDGVTSFQAPSTLAVTNNADVTIVGLSNNLANPSYGNAIEGVIGGTGTFNLGLASDLRTGGAIGSGQTINFTSPGAQLDIGDVTDFQGRIGNFGSDDVIGLTNVAYDSQGTMAASYDAKSSTLTVTDGSQTVATLGHVGAQSAPLYVTSDTRDGGISIGYTPDPSDGLSALNVRPDPKAEIQGADLAMRSNLVRATDVVPGTSTPIDGTGVKIGVISVSFDDTGTAAANEAAGFLPAVKVLADQPGTNIHDEGQAMAEEIHQVAPGAQIDFCAADDGASSSSQQTFADAVAKLQADHCSVIVDDISMVAGPRYQQAGPADEAVQNALNGGVNYFTATGNEGQAFINQTFNAGSATLNTANGPQAVTAHIFDNGTPYERITVPAIGSTSTDTLYLQWNAPYLQGGGYSAAAPQPLKVQLFDSNGNYLPNAQPRLLEVAGQNASVETIALPKSATSQTYYFAVEQTGPGAPPSAFNVTLQSAGGGSGGGGIIDDPQAGMGSDVAGPKLLPGVNSVGAVFYGESAAFGQQPTTNESFSSYGNASQIDYAPDSATPASPPQTFDKPDFSAPDGTVTTAAGDFANGFFGTSAAAPNAAAVAALMLQANPLLSTAQVTQLLEQSAIPFGNPDQSGAGLIQADKAVQAALDLVVCFASGTRLRTPGGDRPVETLAIGDAIVTACGDIRPIVWIGHRRVDCRRHPRPHEVLPVRIRAHAFGEGRPARDLVVSPGHALCVDLLGEVLVPAGALVNGATIVQERVDIVTYWHVELDRHDLVLAENMAAESYLAMGNRRFFGEAGVTTLFDAPDMLVPTHADFCRPFHADGALVAVLRERLAARAKALGWRLEGTPLAGLHLVADGETIVPVVEGLSARFSLPVGSREVWLVSDTAVPAEVGAGADRRRLGVCIGSLAVCDGFGAPRIIGADDARLTLGFHQAEDGPSRWTAGLAKLPAELWDGCVADVFLRVTLARPALLRWGGPRRASIPNRRAA